MHFETLEERRLLAFGGEITLAPVSQSLSSPVAATDAGDGSGRLFVAEQAGQIRILDDGSLLPTPFLDIRARVLGGGERGLLGLAFHPDFDAPGANGAGKFYVYYSAASLTGANHDSVVSEFRVSSSDPNRADPNSERVLLRFAQPFSNHNGGDLKFGPDDGLLYISTGDGGAGGDPQNNAQNLGNLLGAILRIDVNGSDAPGGQYGVPASNPFVNQENARDEIFAYGFRNPYRFSFDDGPAGEFSEDRLFVGDVGQSAREEVDLVFAGGNYGWRIREGSLPFNTNDPDPGDLIGPIAEYPNPDKGRAVIGGFVYRGQEAAGLEGMYLFGDLTGRLFLLEETSGGVFELSEPAVTGGNPTAHSILGFGEDEQGELYVLTSSAIFKVTATAPPRSPWRHPVTPADVNDDGEVNVSDLLEVVRFIRANGFRELPAPNETFSPPPYVDPDDDGEARIRDLLAVVRTIRGS